jgi:hypothetical protein
MGTSADYDDLFGLTSFQAYRFGAYCMSRIAASQRGGLKMGILALHVFAIWFLVALMAGFGLHRNSAERRQSRA